MDATPSVSLPPDAESGTPEQPPVPTRIGKRDFVWGTRTYVMGVINVTPDSFSGDGLLVANEQSAVEAAVRQAQQMVAEGADLLDVGGESTRPGHATIDEVQELDRVAPVIRAVSAALPDTPISIDTTKPSVAVAALDAGAMLLNDIWGTSEATDLARLA